LKAVSPPEALSDMRSAVSRVGRLARLNGSQKGGVMGGDRGLPYDAFMRVHVWLVLHAVSLP